MNNPVAKGSSTCSRPTDFRTVSKPAFSVLIGQYGATRSLRYVGALLFKALSERRNILISFLDLTRSQCNEALTGEM